MTQIGHPKNVAPKNTDYFWKPWPLSKLPPKICYYSKWGKTMDSTLLNTFSTPKRESTSLYWINMCPLPTLFSSQIVWCNHSVTHAWFGCNLRGLYKCTPSPFFLLQKFISVATGSEYRVESDSETGIGEGKQSPAWPKAASPPILLNILQISWALGEVTCWRGLLECVGKEC